VRACVHNTERDSEYCISGVYRCGIMLSVVVAIKLLRCMCICSGSTLNS